jgi:hypothetical protein
MAGQTFLRNSLGLARNVVRIAPERQQQRLAGGDAAVPRVQPR